MTRARTARILAFARRMSIVWWLRIAMTAVLVLTSAVGAVVVYSLAVLVICCRSRPTTHWPSATWS